MISFDNISPKVQNRDKKYLLVNPFKNLVLFNRIKPFWIRNVWLGILFVQGLNIYNEYFQIKKFTYCCKVINLNKSWTYDTLTFFIRNYSFLIFQVESKRTHKRFREKFWHTCFISLPSIFMGLILVKCLKETMSYEFACAVFKNSRLGFHSMLDFILKWLSYQNSSRIYKCSSILTEQVLFYVCFNRHQNSRS